MYSISKLKPVKSDDLIRLGRNEGGGYVINERILDRTELLVSFGIYTDWTFEEDFRKKTKNRKFRIRAYDFSIDFMFFIKISLDYFIRGFSGIRNFIYSLYFIKLSIQFAWFFNRSNVTFFKKGIDEYNHDVFIDFNTIFHEAGKDISPDSVFIKMDVEGYEYKVWKGMLDHSDKIAGFAVEFHDLDLNASLFESLIQLAKEKEYVITHFHPNNWGGVIANTHLPRYVEITFAKRGLFSESELMAINTREYPITGLDFPCITSIPELAMSFDD